MKHIKIIVTLLFLIVTNAMSAPVGTIFSYQGQLNFGGSPANGTYDFKMELWNQFDGGTNLPAQTYEDVLVTDGLFSIELDFGDAPFMGSAKFLKIQVRDGASIGGFEQLSPRQRINNVPYAIHSTFVENSSSPWIDAFSGIQHNGDVVIGNLASDGGDTVQINSDTGDSPLRVLVGTNGTKFRVSSNGGTAIGANISPPSNGLRVTGETQLNGELKQDVDNNGAIKAGLTVLCGDGSPTVITSFNGVNSGLFTMPVGNDAGSCRIVFPFNLDNRFYVSMYVSSSIASSERRLSTCKQEAPGSSNLDCAVTNASGVGVNSIINIIVY